MGERSQRQDSAEQVEHQANVNQVRDEPMPASRHEDRRQEAVVRNEELAARSAQARPRPGERAGRQPEQAGERAHPAADREPGQDD
jgi:hypothetical protein